MRSEGCRRPRPGSALNIKIGGCEALKDMFDAISLGVELDHRPDGRGPICAPKVPRALPKARRSATTRDVEAHDQYRDLDLGRELRRRCFDIPQIEQLHGVVVGQRRPFRARWGWPANQINSDAILKQLARRWPSGPRRPGSRSSSAAGSSAHSAPLLPRPSPKGHPRPLRDPQGDLQLPWGG